MEIGLYHHNPHGLRLACSLWGFPDSGVVSIVRAFPADCPHRAHFHCHRPRGE